MPESLKEKLDRLEAERLAGVTVTHPSNGSSPIPSLHDSDLIPDVGPSIYTPTEEDQEIERLLADIDILDAYRRWCGKMNPDPRNKRESIMISCPRQDHPDKTPSAWVNLDKQTWFCARCNDGGDVMTLVARTKGLEGRTYQEGKNFPDLRREMASDLGYVFRTTPGGQVYAEKMESDSSPESSSTGASETEPACPVPAHISEKSLNGSAPLGAPNTEDFQPDPVPQPDPSGPPADPHISPESTLATITPIFPDDRDDPKPIIPVIQWQDILQPKTFLHEWMSVMQHDDLPEEFYFWHGLLAIGMACGRDVELADRQPVLGNLFVCLFGPSGQGKSRSTSHLTRLLREALPYEYADPDHTGAYLVPSPGSPEILIDSFSRPVEDPADPKRIERYGKVRGLLRFDELSILIGRASRTGNPLKPILQSFYDGDPQISTASRGHGAVEAYESFASCVTTTQPRAIRQVLVASDVDSGFANRWVYVMGHDKPPIPIGGDSLDISEPVWKLKELHGWAAFKHSLVMTEPAKELWVEFYGTDLASCHSTDDAMISRIPLLMKKLVLLLAVNKMEPAVSLETIQAAIMLYPYLKATYAYLGGDLGQGERAEVEQAVIKAVTACEKATGITPTPRNILRRMSSSTRLDHGVLRRVLEDLTAVGVLDEKVIKPKVGRPTVSYSVKA